MDGCNFYHSRCQQYLDKTLLNGLIAGGIGRKEGRQSSYFSAAHPQKSKAVLCHKCLKPPIVPCVHPEWHTDTTEENPSFNVVRISGVKPGSESVAVTAWLRSMNRRCYGCWIWFLQYVLGNLDDWSRSLIIPFHRLGKRSQRWTDSFIV